jgi:hypothetical protein
MLFFAKTTLIQLTPSSSSSSPKAAISNPTCDFDGDFDLFQTCLDTVFQDA